MISSPLSTIRRVAVRKNFFVQSFSSVMDGSPNETRVSEGKGSHHITENSLHGHRTHGTAKRPISTKNSSSGAGGPRTSSNSTGRKRDGLPGIEKTWAEFLSGDDHNHDTDKSKVRGRSRKNSKIRGNDTTSTSVKIETSNFQSIFHKNMARAAKYKVHAPNCTCPKVKTIRERYMISRQSIPTQQNDGQWGVTAKINSTTSSSYNDTILYDIDGSISQLFDKKLQVSAPEHITNTSKQLCVETDSIFNNLIVLPDTNRPSTVYVCKDTDSRKFAENGTACEQKLSMEIFGSNAGTVINGVDDWPSFKVSCAICLLTSHYLNGFVAMVSESLDQLDTLVQRAREAVEANRAKVLHSDHAHFVCALDIPSLQSLLQNSKTRTAVLQAKKHILIQMADAGVKLSTDVNSFISSDGQVFGQDVQILLGHHLSTLLHIFAAQCPKNSLLIPSDQSRQLQYIMINGYQDGHFKWTLDLPGGKRHLGESTLKAAIREVKEECSLLLDEKWMEDLVPSKYGGGADCHDSLNESLRETAGGFARVFEKSGDAFIVMIPSS